jgi:hypothetical protein
VLDFAAAIILPPGKAGEMTEFGCAPASAIL